MKASPKHPLPCDARVLRLLETGGTPYSRQWIDEATEVVGAICALRLAFQRMHRRAQKAEAELRRAPAHHYGRNILATLAKEKKRTRALRRQVSELLRSSPVASAVDRPAGWNY